MALAGGGSNCEADSECGCGRGGRMRMEFFILVTRGKAGTRGQEGRPAYSAAQGGRAGGRRGSGVGVAEGSWESAGHACGAGDWVRFSACGVPCMDDVAGRCRAWRDAAMG